MCPILIIAATPCNYYTKRVKKHRYFYITHIYPASRPAISSAWSYLRATCTCTSTSGRGTLSCVPANSASTTVTGTSWTLRGGTPLAASSPSTAWRTSLRRRRPLAAAAVAAAASCCWSRRCTWAACRYTLGRPTRRRCGRPRWGSAMSAASAICPSTASRSSSASWRRSRTRVGTGAEEEQDSGRYWSRGGAGLG
jgi:hypothetical protein